MLISLVSSIFVSIFMFFAGTHNKDTSQAINIIKEVNELEPGKTNDNYIVVNDDFARGCTQDSECESVRADICGCNAGGKARAVIKWKKQIYLQKLRDSNKNIMCTQVLSNDKSCSAVPICSKQLKTCVLKLK